MVIVWRGKSAQISLEQGNSFVNFKLNVPTWMSQVNYRSLHENSGFEEYLRGEILIDPQPTVVFVALPSELPLFLASILTLRKIRQTHPTSQIDVMCPSAYAELVNVDGCRIVAARNSTTYYREFILTSEANQILCDRNALVTTPLQQLVLHVSGLLETGVDQPDCGCVIDTPTGVGECILSAEIGEWEQLAGVSDALITQYPGRFPNVNLNKPDVRVNPMLLFNEVHALIKKTNTVICLGESMFTLLAAALGRRVLMFRLPNISADFSRQYLCYPNVEVIKAAGAVSLAELANKIINMLNSEPQPEIRKWQRNGLNHDGDSTPATRSKPSRSRQRSY